MKNKYIKTLPLIVILISFTLFGGHQLKVYYDEILNSTGLIYEDFNSELKNENQKAIESEDEYQRILSSLEDISQEEISAEQDKNYTDQSDESKKEEKLSLHATSALLLDAENNRVLYEKNGYDKMAMASTTKIMTCIVTLENSNLDGIVTISSYAASMPDVQLNVRKGEQFYLRDLLYSLMLESHNDVAVAIAEYVGGSVEGFAAMMNDKAKELGCNDTNFVTPNGLDAEGHYTTARDLAVIASYAIKNKKFIDITNTSAHTFKEIKNGRSFAVSNKNKFLYMMEGAIGIKTGFTGDAGYCFVGAIKRTDRTLISVVLGCGWPPNKSLKWHDTKELMTYGIKNYEEKQIYKDVDFDPVFVKDGQQKYEALDMEGDLSLLMREDEAVKIVYEVPKLLHAPIEAGIRVGIAKYYIGDMLYAELPIYTTKSIMKIDFRFCMIEILRMWSAQY